MRTHEDFCCEYIKTLSAGYEAPLDRRSNSNEFGLIGYGFADRQIDFCPSCGALLHEHFPPITLRKPTNPDFCCITMQYDANVPDEHTEFEIFYQRWARRYFFSTATGDWRLCGPEGTIFKEWDFYYCLYCGKKLPESLLNVWLEIVKKEFGIDKKEPIEKMLQELPEEFTTDSWWKKLGL